MNRTIYSSSWEDAGHGVEDTLLNDVLPEIGVSVVDRSEVGKDLKQTQGLDFAVARASQEEDGNLGIDYFFYIGSGGKNKWVGINFTTARELKNREDDKRCRVNLQGTEVEIDVFLVKIPMFVIENAASGAERDQKTVIREFAAIAKKA